MVPPNSDKWLLKCSFDSTHKATKSKSKWSPLNWTRFSRWWNRWIDGILSNSWPPVHFTRAPLAGLGFFPKASSMLGFSFSCLTAWGSDLGCADGCGRQMGAEIAWTAADGVGATEWLEMGGEKKPLVMSDLGCADGCGQQMGAEIAWTAADGVGATEWLEMGGEKKPLVMSDLGCADGCGRQMGAENCADGCGRRGCNGVWLEMGGEKKPLVMSDLGCADGCGRQMGAENCVDGCERRGRNGVAGNGWGEEAAGDERPWLRGRLRTANGCGELRGRLRTAWVQGGGSKWVGRRSRWWWATLAARTANGRRELRGRWLEMGGEKKPLVMSDLGCADGCGRQMGAENCADGCGRRGCNGVAGNEWGEEAAGDERPWLRGRLRTANGCGELRGRLRTAWVQRSGWKWVGRRSRWWWATLAARTAAVGKWVRRTARMAADSVGATEWLEMGGEKGKEGKGWERNGQKGKGRDRKGKEGKGWERNEKGRSRWWWATLAARKAVDGKWVRRTARTAADGVGATECGCKWVERRSRWWWATLAARTAADGKWVRRTAWTAADGVGATEWLEMGGEKKPLVMSDLGCAEGCGRQMGAENCAVGCGRRGCKGVAGNGWGEEAAGDERPWLRGRLRTANGCGELRGRLRTAWVQGGGWKWVGRRSRWWWATLAAHGCGRQVDAENCADGCGRRGCKGVAGNGLGEEAAGDERRWLRTAWVQGGGWKWVGRRSRWWWATLAARTAADSKWVRRTARTAANGVGARGWREMVGEKKTLVMSDLGCADGCGRQMGAENCADGCGRRGCKGVARNGWGEEAAGDERPWLRGRLRTANGCGELRGRLRTAWVQGGGWKWVGRRSSDLGCADGCGQQMGAEKRTAWVQRSGWKLVGRRSRWWWATLAARTAADGKWVRRTARTAADGVGAREKLEMGEEKKPLVMSELGCADGCGREMGAESGDEGAWLHGRRWTGNGCREVRGRLRTAWVQGSRWKRMGNGGDKKPLVWLPGRQRTANGWGEWRGRLRTAWVQGSGWKWVGRRRRWWWATLAARTAADGKRVRRTAQTAADGVGATEWLEIVGGRRSRWGWASLIGCADGCGRAMAAENSTDDCGQRGCNWVGGNGWGEAAAGDERPWLCGRLRTGNGCGEVHGRLRTAWVQGSGWKWVGRRSRWCDERAWLRGRLRTANGLGELRGRLRTAWVPGCGWKCLGRRSRWRSASLAVRTAAGGKWMRRIARTAPDGVGATEWLEMGGEKRPLVMCELSCADGCGREMAGENCADGCGRRGCKGVARNSWGEEQDAAHEPECSHVC